MFSEITSDAGLSAAVLIFIPEDKISDQIVYIIQHILFLSESCSAHPTPLPLVWELLYHDTISHTPTEKLLL